MHWTERLFCYLYAAIERWCTPTYKCGNCGKQERLSREKFPLCVYCWIELQIEQMPEPKKTWCLFDFCPESELSVMVNKYMGRTPISNKTD